MLTYCRVKKARPRDVDLIKFRIASFIHFIPTHLVHFRLSFSYRLPTMVAPSTTQIVLFINDAEANLAVATDASDPRLNKLQGQTFGTRIDKDENKDTELTVRCCVGGA